MDEADHHTGHSRIVTFLNNSHYWGVQLKEQARKDNLK